MPYAELEKRKSELPRLADEIARVEAMLEGGRARLTPEEVGEEISSDKGLALVVLYIFEQAGLLTHRYAFFCPSTEGHIAEFVCNIKDVPDALECPHHAGESVAHRTDNECFVELSFERADGGGAAQIADAA